MSYSKKKSSQLSRLSRPLPVIGGLVIIVALVIAGLELTNTTHIFHKAPLAKTAVITTTSSPTKSKAAPSQPKTAATNNAASTTASATAGPSTSTKDTATGGSSTSSATLIAPGGDFVSTHTPNLGDMEDSVCNTTPGATCTITFTMGGITRSLGAQTTDSSGSTSWQWTVDNNSSGQGTWQITVTASLNGQTKTVPDPRAFQVGP